jgi:hypothetical protein
MSHIQHIRKVLEKAALRAILRREPPSLRLVSVPEMAEELSIKELHQLIRSAYALATEGE